MNAERLLAHYERIAEAPDAVARLRRFILDLAMRGKLVPQDPKDEPASELLKRIANRKLQIARKEKAKKSPRNINEDAEAIQLPTGWTIAPLAALVSILNGRAYKQTELLSDGTPVLRVGNLFTSDKWYYSNLQLEPDKYCEKGDLIFAWSASFGPFIWNGEKVIFHYHIWKLPLHSEADLDKLYLFNFLLQKTREIKEAGHGISMIHMTKEKMELLQVPLPPLAEQRRIVAKVDELMALCDQLDKARTEREATRDRLATATLARLNDPDPETFQADARFALDALPAITTRPDQVKQLRQTILNLAVRGRLVAQDPKDEPASEMLKKIAAERADLVKRREIRREEPIDPPKEGDLPFEVPAQWMWSRIGDAVLFTQYGTSQKSHPSEKGVPVLTMGNVQDGLVVWNNEKRIPETSEDLPALYLQKFDLLYNRTNSAELVGKTGIYLGENEVRTFASYLIRLRLSLRWTNPRFVNIAMNTSKFRETQIVPLIKKQTGQANVNGTALKNMLVPLPPLAEQHRIVAKVDELMSLCDRLEAGLTTCQDVRSRLLDALLHEALEPVSAELEAAA